MNKIEFGDFRKMMRRWAAEGVKQVAASLVKERVKE